MGTFVLVSGAWHGGWCYRDTARNLRARGHDVHTPTHTGVGDRAHLATPDIGLSTHIDDVCATIESEELTDVILCGHSYGGMVISGVADRLPHLIKSMVYLDAFIPDDGDSMNDLALRAMGPDVGSQVVAAWRASAADSGRAEVAPFPAEALNVVPERRAWVDRRMTPQALATYEEKIELRGAIDTIEQKVYILASGWEGSPFPYFAKLVDALPGWRVLTWPVGHDVMIDAPADLAEELAALA